MIRNFTILDSSTGKIDFKAKEFDNTNNVVFTVYDTPTQYQLSELTSTGLSPSTPDYYVWRTLTETSTGLGYNYLRITNTSLFTNKRTKPTINYDDLYDTNLHLMTSQEYECLQLLAMQLDTVHRRYPHKFQKKFTVEEMLVFIEAALIDVNITVPVTKFWWFFEQERSDIQEQVNNMGDLFRAGVWTVPVAFRTMIAQGALIYALISRGILEVDANFSYSDQGISLTYDNAGGYSTWYSALVAQYIAAKKVMKDNYRPKGRGIGSYPDFGLGWFGLVNSALDNRYSQTFYPWFLSYGGRPQI